MRHLAWSIMAASLLVAGSGCQLAHDLLPRTHTMSTSPDGRHVAYVYQQLNPDPPDDHVAIANDGAVTFDRYRRATMLLRGSQGVIEAPVTISGTYGRPIHRPEQFLGQQRLHLTAAGPVRAASR